MSIRALTALLLIATLLTSACGALSSSAAPAVAGAVIVKPRTPGEAAAVVRAAQSVLGSDAGVRYVRPLAGDAHLLHLTAPATREQVPELVERLRRSAVFQYVEQDSMMKIQ